MTKNKTILFLLFVFFLKVAPFSEVIPQSFSTKEVASFSKNSEKQSSQQSTQDSPNSDTDDDSDDDLEDHEEALILPKYVFNFTLQQHNFLYLLIIPSVEHSLTSPPPQFS